MKAGKTIAIAVLAALGFATFAGNALAKDRSERDRRNRNHDHWENWDNRRDARRAGVIAGTVAAGIAGAASSENAREDFRRLSASETLNGFRMSAAGEKSVEAARQVLVPRISPAHGRSWVGSGMAAFPRIIGLGGADDTR
jgi:hypothetical protein